MTYSNKLTTDPARSGLIRFGNFQLDAALGQLLRNGRVVPLKPQPFKLLHLLASRPGELITREEIREALWGTDTHVDFDQGVNTAIRQVRDALKEDADRPLFVETIPKRGYRFIAPVEAPQPPAPNTSWTTPRTDLNLQKALWLNIAELRVAEVRRRQRRIYAIAGALLGAVVLMLVTYWFARS